MFYNIPDECRENDAACRNTSQVVKLKINLLQHLLVLQSLYNVTTNATWKLCRATKIVLLLSVSTCRATSFECLRHIHLSLRQSTTYRSMTLKAYSLSYSEHGSNWYFSIHSMWRYMIKEVISYLKLVYSASQDYFNTRISPIVIPSELYKNYVTQTGKRQVFR